MESGACKVTNIENVIYKDIQYFVIWFDMGIEFGNFQNE